MKVWYVWRMQTMMVWCAGGISTHSSPYTPRQIWIHDTIIPPDTNIPHHYTSRYKYSSPLHIQIQIFLTITPPDTNIPHHYTSRYKNIPHKYTSRNKYPQPIGNFLIKEKGECLTCIFCIIIIIFCIALHSPYDRHGDHIRWYQQRQYNSAPKVSHSEERAMVTHGQMVSGIVSH